MSRISRATACGLQAERGDERGVDRRACSPARASWAWAAIRSARSTRIICGPAARKPSRVSRRGRPASAAPRCDSGGSAGIGCARGGGAEGGAPAHRLGLQHRRHEQVERADADAEPGHRAALVAVERGERLGDRFARDDAAFVDQHGEQGAHRGRRGRILRGMAGGAQRRRAPPRRRRAASP